MLSPPKVKIQFSLQTAVSIHQKYFFLLKEHRGLWSFSYPPPPKPLCCAFWHQLHWPVILHAFQWNNFNRGFHTILWTHIFFLSSSWVFLTLVHHISLYDLVGLPAHSLGLYCCSAALWRGQSKAAACTFAKSEDCIRCVTYPGGSVLLEPGLHNRHELSSAYFRFREVPNGVRPHCKNCTAN